MNTEAAADIVIIGGGIAGMWLLNRLRQQGLSAILFESNAIGSGQTQKSQGIIHGGTKYALHSVLTNEVKAIAAMPGLWKDCLSGKGEIDLSNVPILSEKQYLWSPNRFTAKFTGFLASNLLKSQVNSLNKEEYPAPFQHPAFKGQVYALDEIVIDVQAMTRELAKNNQDAIFKVEPVSAEGFKFNEAGDLVSITLYQAGKSIEVFAQQFVFTAGSGNEAIIHHLKPKQIAMQRRPLHMVLVKTPFDLPLYAHCLGIGNRPRITITTHYTLEGETIWYLGGTLAEEGVKKDSAQQIRAAQQELHALFPWLDFSKADYSTLMIDRAEPLQKNGAKPDHAFMQAINNMIIAWPTKLVLAPQLAQDIIDYFANGELQPKLLDTRELRAWPMPSVAKPIWEELFCKDVA